MTTGEIEAKGTTFLSVLGAIEVVRGAEFRARVVQACDDELREALRTNTVLAAGWYPIAWYRELLAAAVRVEGLPSVIRDIGRASIRVEVTGVNRLFFKLLSTETLVKQSNRVFKTYFRPTELETSMLAPGVGRTRYVGCRGFSGHCWAEQVGCVEELLVQSGARAPRVRIVEGGQDGDATMVLESQWR